MSKSFDGTRKIEGESFQSMLHRLDSYSIQREIERAAWARDPERYARQVWAQISRWAEG